VADKERKKYRLEVALDASQARQTESGQRIKAVAQLQDGSLHEIVAKLPKDGKGEVIFEFDEHPGQVRILLGPGDASAEEILNLQTLTRTVQTAQWSDKRSLNLTVIIPAYYLVWWLWWCRTFTIRGRVVCPDGRPVPGATVCAYDIDLFWWWVNKQSVGCATTDIDGTFEITFNWCCGWWPWYWWNWRRWVVDPVLSGRIIEQLRELKIRKIPIPDPIPDPYVFQEILAGLGSGPLPPLPVQRTLAAGSAEMKAMGTLPGAAELEAAGMETARMATTQSQSINTNLRGHLLEPGLLESLRPRLAEALQPIPDLVGVHLWPWWPWYPWWDCSPDIIFEITQPCEGGMQVVLEESWPNTRWDIPTELDVTLVTNELACCLDDHEDPLGDCLFLSHVCSGITIDEIGGNLGAPALPPALNGYASPGSSDRPFAGSVPVYGEFGDTAPADYYEFEWWNPDHLPLPDWEPIPPNSFSAPTRTYFGPGLAAEPGLVHNVPFPLTPMDGRNVVESRHHFEAGHDPLSWGVTRGWFLNSAHYLGSIQTGAFADGLHRFRVTSYALAGGHLDGGHVLDQCYVTPGVQNYLLLRIDNRVTGTASGHPSVWPDHPCGGTTVHTCTLEPETVILNIKILNPDETLKALVGPCGEVEVDEGDLVQFDFVAYDIDGHLDHYWLQVTYGENQVQWLANGGGLNAGVGASFVLSPGPLPAAQEGPSYWHALVDTPAATRPTWQGGAISIRANAADVFPITCSYQLELRAYKRTIVSCDGDLIHRNLSERSFAVQR
jgi:hypothetical protein